ncbi:zinc-ribbon domain-containing protein [Butyricicoccus pullicaecorum]|nr:zinc-ribbon domain-containing protein [Butyricicoccus pullicaecorum]
MGTSLYDYCMAHDKEAVLREWHSFRNSGLSPEDVTYGSNRTIWWLCEQGHEWRQRINDRIQNGHGCPYCAGKKVWLGFNDLASQRPEIAKQWHPTLNGTRTPEMVTIRSHKAIWWVCEKGHEWKAIVKSRTDGCGCPYCTNRAILPGFNDLATTHPELAKQWHPTKNRRLAPQNITAGTIRKAWWRCEKGHEWQATVASRASGVGCPVCAGKVIVPGENDLKTFFPDIAAQWHPTQNGDMKPEALSPYSNQSVWWLCPKGHDYRARVAARTSHGSGCPYCAGKKIWPGFNDLASLEPQVAKQWHPTLNGTLTPEMVTPGSSRKVWWQCPDGHVWKAVIHSRARGRKCGCPVCAGRVKPERLERYAALMAERTTGPGAYP